MTEKEQAVKFPTLRWDLNVYNILIVLVTAAGFYTATNLRLTTSEEQARKYIPIIEELQRKDVTQDARMANMIESAQDLRRLVNDQVITQSKTNAEVLAQLSAIRETLAWFRATLENSGAPRQPQPRTP